MTPKFRFFLLTAIIILAMFPSLVFLNEVRIKRYTSVVAKILDSAVTVDQQFDTITSKRVSGNRLSNILRGRGKALTELEKSLDSHWCPGGMIDLHDGMMRALEAHQAGYEALAVWMHETPGDSVSVADQFAQAQQEYDAMAQRLRVPHRSVVKVNGRMITGIHKMAVVWEQKRQWKVQTVAFLGEYEKMLQELSVDRNNMSDWVKKLKDGPVDQNLINALAENTRKRADLAGRMRELTTPPWAMLLRDETVGIIADSATVCQYYIQYAKDTLAYQQEMASIGGYYDSYYAPTPPNPLLLDIASDASAANTKALKKVDDRTKSLRAACEGDSNNSELPRRW